ncbi:MAG TPA: hypothetical protein VJ853_09560 [Thermoanaerobaculia bacterium]|nr:hypothetical protein [Thermoanaerobaculia bacterium]
MPIDIDPPAGERVFVNVHYRASKQSVPFALGITDQAVYVPAKKRWAMGDPWYIQRVPITQVRDVFIKRTRMLGILIVAALMVAGGGIATYLMLEPIVHGQGGKISGWPFAVLIGGLILPFFARGRRSLRIVFSEGKYIWTPPIAVDAPSRAYIQQLLDHIIGGFRQAGVHAGEF